jgi:adenine deaminase
MMNFPGVLNQDPEVMQKIRAAHALNKPIDGHAPGLRGATAKAYIEAGISTDHECFTKEEALDKLEHGMKIIIREGSAAKNFEALIELLEDHPNLVMFCSDDKHPDSLEAGHINQLCARAVAKGIDLFIVLRAASVNPVLHYDLDMGLLCEGDDADFIVTDDLTNFIIKQTYINGQLVAENGKSLINSVEEITINQFDCAAIAAEDLIIAANAYPVIEGKIPVMEALDGQLITNKLWLEPSLEAENLVSDTNRDLLKMVVVNRYHAAPIAKCFIQNFGFKRGAIASSVAHDSHNIVAVGVDDVSLAKAINLVIKERGGVSVVDGDLESVLGLPVAGLMSTDDGYQVAAAYTKIDRMAKDLGSSLQAPFMTLSFMALLVIPHLKLSDKGLFDGDNFSFIPLVQDQAS